MTVRGQVRHAFPAYKVFIFGVEVTEDVLDVEVQYNVGRAPNVCSVTLANELDKYIFTTNDLKNLFGGIQAEAAQIAQIKAFDAQGLDIAMGIEPDDIGRVNPDQQDIDQAILERVNVISPEIKRVVIEQKVTKRIPGVEQPNVVGKVDGSIKPLTGDAFRYPLQAEDPIFHPNDPIRIFYKDPFNPRRWYHAFAGFLSDFDDNVDENNQKILTITGEGPTKIFRYGRITTNPGVIDIGAIQIAELDASFRSAYISGFKGLNLPELLFTITFGNNPDDPEKFSVQRDSPDGSSVQAGKLRGVGNFNFSRSLVVEFGPTSVGGRVDIISGQIKSLNVSELGQYQAIIDHEVKETDLIEMLIENSEDESAIRSQIQTLPKRIIGDDEIIDPLAIIGFIGTRPEKYPVDGGRLILCIPASFHPEANREVLLKDIIDSFAMNTEFKSRLGIVFDTIERIEFVFYESPKGDLICEFPLYDFDPDDFGLDERFPHVDTLSLQENSDVQRGPFGNRFIIGRRDTYNFSKGITDEKIRTQVTAPHFLLQNYTNESDSNVVQPPAVVTLRHLLPLYGARLEQVNPKGFISSPEAALVYAQITLNKLNADARSIGINAVPNFGVWLNRPLFFQQRNCIGTLMSTSHNIKWGMGGSVDTRYNINYLRGWDGLVDSNGNPVYTPIGGIPSRPLDYKLLFGLKGNIESGSVSDSPGESDFGSGTGFA